jgi:hypothetical protein
MQPNIPEIKAINEIKNYYDTKLKNLENKKINVRKKFLIKIIIIILKILII